VSCPLAALPPAPPSSPPATTPHHREASPSAREAAWQAGSREPPAQPRSARREEPRRLMSQSRLRPRSRRLAAKTDSNVWDWRLQWGKAKPGLVYCKAQADWCKRLGRLPWDGCKPSGTRRGAAEASCCGRAARGQDKRCGTRAAAGCTGGEQDAGPSALATHRRCERGLQTEDQTRAVGTHEPT
jgi:hypothetical protein